jgi:hypothetical protein
MVETCLGLGTGWGVHFKAISVISMEDYLAIAIKIITAPAP